MDGGNEVRDRDASSLFAHGPRRGVGVASAEPARVRSKSSGGAAQRAGLTQEVDLMITVELPLGLPPGTRAGSMSWCLYGSYLIADRPT